MSDLGKRLLVIDQASHAEYYAAARVMYLLGRPSDLKCAALLQKTAASESESARAYYAMLYPSAGVEL